MIKYIAALISALFIGVFSILVGISITICHHTGSAGNPYTNNTVSINSISDLEGFFKSGHGSHPEDAWKSFVFEGITYPGQNEGVFGSLIDESCNLIVPPTATSTPTDTPTATQTSTATLPPPPTPTETSTNTPTPRVTLPPPPPTETSTPTEGPSPTPTSTATEGPSPTPTETSLPPTPTQTSLPPTPTETQPPEPTETPRPPMAASAINSVDYPSTIMGTMDVNDNSYVIYFGVNAPNGTLLLPSKVKGGALYNNQIWLHRAWNSGWFNLKIGDILTITSSDGKSELYKVTNNHYEPYGKYFNDGKLHIVTCYGEVNWEGVEVFDLELVWKERFKDY